jgi:hypothetical protein
VAADVDPAPTWSVIVGAKGPDYAYITKNREPLLMTPDPIPPLGWWSTELWVGGLGAGSFAHGEIAEVAIYGRAMPEDEARGEVATCLGDKYGIPLDPFP